MTVPTFHEVAKAAQFRGFSHVTWYVSNTKQAASFFKIGMGFETIAFKDLRTGSRNVTSHVISNGNVVFVFKAVTRNPETISDSDPEKKLAQDIVAHVGRHGDSVKDVAFEVNGIESIYEKAIKGGAKAVQEITVFSDKDGSAKLAIVGTPCSDTTHTLVEKKFYSGAFLPGYASPSHDEHDYDDPLYEITTALRRPIVDCLDHCVANLDWNGLESACQFYETAFGFHRFWSADCNVITTKFSALSSVVMASPGNHIKLPINEPAKGMRKSQIEEFVEYHDGPGIQHIAFQTKDILQTVSCMQARGVEFLAVPSVYYENLRVCLKIKANCSNNRGTAWSLKESLDALQMYNILVDFDDQGYLLQIFTTPLSDRPTVFIEIIQREGHDGFGAGNFKALFEAIEQEQRKRGNL